jgi:hypothetical protein
MLEFQSTVDTWMTLRMLVYVGLLHQDLVRRKQLTANGRLPPVLPIVLYNGEARWTAATEIVDLIEPVTGNLRHYLPRQRHLVIDEGRIVAGEQAGLRNLAAGLFRLEHSRTPEDMEYLVRCLCEWLTGPEQSSLRRAFAHCMKQVLLPARMPGIEFEALNDLQEVHNMLAERVKTWTEEWKNQGLNQGISQGIIQGESLVRKRLLHRRFSELSPELEQRLDLASSDELAIWADRLLDAQTLDEVFH